MLVGYGRQITEVCQIVLHVLSLKRCYKLKLSGFILKAHGYGQATGAVGNIVARLLHQYCNRFFARCHKPFCRGGVPLTFRCETAHESVNFR